MSKIIPSVGMLKFKKGIFLSQIVILCLLSLAIIFVALPSYFTGKWSWSDLPPVPEIDQMRKIPKAPLNFPGWQTITQKEIRISKDRWSFQVIEKPGQEPITVAMMPQNYYKNHPQVEWVDLQGVEKWKPDNYKTLKFSSDTDPKNSVTARWFQAWNNNTYGVLQWYAWPGGGHYAPSQWFWADQKAQLHRKRVPWIVVSIEIPMEPLGELKDIEPLAKSLGQTVQTTLEKDIFDVKKN
ncbi:cyanoexosortase B system-associated protein [Crocosphaera sp. UHCC 0190]|uniref:cyanoexosortase B system-associated protein n=1 Tax=Crocosphaera sp. UHCC 0190 TaxID=3110246 RepID=UPI002B1FD6C1|nr:cyanoexosortase B system-associated protein [Crocosphaera sp. UHCC 0190]MEA5512209.1 cyanoexosortase B system-associated protein [Crocosphaera sp. UHCC 0190]